MKTLSDYPKKRIFITTLLGSIIGSFATIWAIITTPYVDCVVKIAAVTLVLILIIYHCTLVRKRKEFGVEGIVRIYKDNNYSDITKQLSKAKHTIEIIVYHGNNLLFYTKNGIIDALKRDVDVKLLIAHKESVLLKEAQELEGCHDNNDQIRAWGIIREIESEANGKTCSIRYFKYHTQARYALVIVDGKWAWWTPYHPGINVPETSSFVLVDNGEKSIIRECKKHFRTLWIKLEKENENNSDECRHKQTTLPARCAVAACSICCVCPAVRPRKRFRRKTY